MSVAHRVWRLWSAVWDFEAEARTLNRLRIAVGLLFAAVLASLLPNAALLFDAELGLPVELMRARLHGWRLDWFDHLVGVQVQAFIGLGIGASLLFAAGILPQVAAPVAFMVHLGLQWRNYAWMDGSDDLARTLLFYLWLVPWRRGAKRYPGWPLRLAQLQVATMYAATAIFKAQGSDWVSNGSALYWVLSDPRWTRFAMNDLVATNWGQTLLGALTYATVVVEGALPVLLLWPRTRRIGVLVGVGLHLGIHALMVVGLFSPAVLVSYLAFWDGDLLPRRRRWAPQPAPVATPAPPV